MENKKLELKQNFINTQPDSLKDIIEYCKENIKSMDLSDETDDFLCRACTVYLMKHKIGYFDNNEAKFLTLYFAKCSAKLIFDVNKVKGKIDINILPTEEYKKLRGEKGIAVCIPNEDKSHTLIYSEEKVTDQLRTDDPYKFLRTIQTICHEVVHVYQNIRLQRDYKEVNALQAKKGYIMALEKITRLLFPNFYKENYTKLLSENDAEEWGLTLALNFIRAFNKDVYELFDKEEIQTRIEQYRKRATEEKNIVGKYLPTLKAMEFLANSVPEYRKLFPILEVAYHKEGTRKTITELLEDRQERISEDEAAVENSNELLLTILNSRDATSEERLQEIKELDEYIISKCIEDEFTYNLLTNRLQKYGMKETSIQEYIEIIKTQVKMQKDEYKDKVENTAECIEKKSDFSDITTKIDEYSKKQEDAIHIIATEQEQTSDDEKVVEDTDDIGKY